MFIWQFVKLKGLKVSFARFISYWTVLYDWGIELIVYNYRNDLNLKQN